MLTGKLAHTRSYLLYIHYENHDRECFFIIFIKFVFDSVQKITGIRSQMSSTAYCPYMVFCVTQSERCLFNAQISVENQTGK